MIPMKYISLLVFTVLLGCNAANVPTESAGDTLQLSTPVQKASPQTAVADSLSPTLTLSEIKQDWIAKYSDTITIDTTFATKKGEVHIVFSNYCLFDSSLTVPKLYVEMYGMDKFVSHNFASSVAVQVSGSTAVNTIIDKSFFEEELVKNDFYHLYDYGALLFNGIDISAEFLDIRYSIVVPLSDVGSGFKARIYYNGRKKAIY
jgi:hypothetical protein